LADSQQPLIVPKFTNPPTGNWVTVTEFQKGSGVDTRSANEFPFINNGSIKLSSFTVPNAGGVLAPTFSQVTIYASVANPLPDGSLQRVFVTNSGGQNWTTTAPPPNYMANQGNYDSAILAVSQATVYVGGHESDPTTHDQQLFQSTNSGNVWNNISVDSAKNG